ncbi:hypothetical protein, partial [Akkermansia sp.]|uniref:hypothetical protein n=1 Tax=Akkermansia sp. TaxID=1872421 RepID=UPI003AEFCB70
ISTPPVKQGCFKPASKPHDTSRKQAGATLIFPNSSLRSGTGFFFSPAVVCSRGNVELEYWLI